ncbi:MAG: hypothetical protein AAB433_06570 [Nitrospirota bacterium]
MRCGEALPIMGCGAIPAKNEAGHLVVLLLTECAASEGKKGEPPDHPSCSLSPPGETVVAQCAQ